MIHLNIGAIQVSASCAWFDDSSKLFKQYQRDELQRLVPQAQDAVALTGRAEGHVPGFDSGDGAVVAVFAPAAEDEVDLPVARVDVVADAAAGMHGGVGKGAALAQELLGGVDQVPDGQLSRRAELVVGPVDDSFAASADHVLLSPLSLFAQYT